MAQFLQYPWLNHTADVIDLTNKHTQAVKHLSPAYASRYIAFDIECLSDAHATFKGPVSILCIPSAD